MSGLRAILLAAAIVAASPVHAADWDATWVGGFEDGGDGVQVIAAGDTVVGFFLGGDYVDVTDVGTVGTDGSLAFKWEGGPRSAVLVTTASSRSVLLARQIAS